LKSAGVVSDSSGEFRVTDARPQGAAAIAYDSERRVLLASPHGIRSRPWGGVTYEFLDVVRGLENSVFAEPSATTYSARPLRLVSDELVPLVQRVSALARAGLGRPSPRTGARVEVEGNFDLCFYACQFAREISEIECIPSWRQRSRMACAFILETWPDSIERDRADYRLLDRFDMVFVLNAAAIPSIRQHTSTPVVFLPTAADTLLLPAAHYANPRVIDLICIGRRRGSMHAAFIDYADSRGKLYLYDQWTDMRVRNWPEARRYNAILGARSQAYVVWSPLRAGLGHQGDALSTRYFEGAAGGTVMIGSRPEVPEFAELFDWPDAVLDVPEDPGEVAAFLDALYADPNRLRDICWRNRRGALLKHDWAHRWAAVLDALGLAPTAAHRARNEVLSRRIEEEAAYFRPGRAAGPEPVGREAKDARGARA
jgi:Glycosyl transferases group 1